MKANELRIGNYLEMLGKVRKVECISNLPARKEMYWLTCENMIDTKIIHFSPIELNKEWFNKLGMTYYSLPTKSNRSVGYYTVKYGNRFKINSSDGNYSFVNFIKDIRYVHELQNLYFAITGTELTYENETK